MFGLGLLGRTQQDSPQRNLVCFNHAWYLRILKALRTLKPKAPKCPLSFPIPMETRPVRLAQAHWVVAVGHQILQQTTRHWPVLVATFAWAMVKSQQGVHLPPGLHPFPVDFADHAQWLANCHAASPSLQRSWLTSTRLARTAQICYLAMNGVISCYIMLYQNQRIVVACSRVIKCDLRNHCFIFFTFSWVVCLHLWNSSLI